MSTASDHEPNKLAEGVSAAVLAMMAVGGAWAITGMESHKKLFDTQYVPGATYEAIHQLNWTANAGVVMLGVIVASVLYAVFEITHRLNTIINLLMLKNTPHVVPREPDVIPYVEGEKY